MGILPRAISPADAATACGPLSAPAPSPADVRVPPAELWGLGWASSNPAVRLLTLELSPRLRELEPPNEFIAPSERAVGLCIAPGEPGVAQA